MPLQSHKEVLNHFLHASISLCRFCYRIWVKQWCLWYAIASVIPLCEKKQNIMAASCFGICSGDEILGRSLVLEGEKEYKEKQNSPSHSPPMHSHVHYFVCCISINKKKFKHLYACRHLITLITSAVLRICTHFQFRLNLMRQVSVMCSGTRWRSHLIHSYGTVQGGAGGLTNFDSVLIWESQQITNWGIPPSQKLLRVNTS